MMNCESVDDEFFQRAQSKSDQIHCRCIKFSFAKTIGIDYLEGNDCDFRADMYIKT